MALGEPSVDLESAYRLPTAAGKPMIVEGEMQNPQWLALAGGEAALPGQSGGALYGLLVGSTGLDDPPGESEQHEPSCHAPCDRERAEQQEHRRRCRRDRGHVKRLADLRQ